MTVDCLLRDWKIGRLENWKIGKLVKIPIDGSWDRTYKATKEDQELYDV
jgi:hypothetical protein